MYIASLLLSVTYVTYKSAMQVLIFNGGAAGFTFRL